MTREERETLKRLIEERRRELEDAPRDEKPARKPRRATHCRRGHELYPENLYWRPNGYAECRACRYGKERARHGRLCDASFGSPSQRRKQALLVARIIGCRTPAEVADVFEEAAA